VDVLAAGWAAGASEKGSVSNVQHNTLHYFVVVPETELGHMLMYVR
jgi:hypothetical protein